MTELETAVRQLHSRVGNAVTEGCHIVFGVGSTHLIYILEERIDDASHTVQWRVLVEKVSDKVKAQGIFKLEPAAGGCTRIIQGEVKVSVPFIGRKIEAGIAAELEKSYEATAKFATQWLKDRT